MHSLLPAAIEIAEAAGDAVLAIYERDCDAWEKGDKSPLTEADLAAHHLIVSRLAALSDLPVLSEESAAMDWPVRQTWRHYWLVDPLDGTKEFLSRNGEFTVNIALITDGRPVLGVVHAPALQRTYFAARGNGAYRRDRGVEAVTIRVASECDSELRLVGSRSHQSPEMARFLDALGSVEFVSMGSSLKFCLVAEGSADLYPRLAPTNEWDTGAAQCIVEEAGGEVLSERLVPLRYNTKDSLLNPHFVACGFRHPAWMRPFASGMNSEAKEGTAAC